jgi:L-rhamnose isomerase/sugar isomerase
MNVSQTVRDTLKRQHIETPSWGYSNAGTRFKTFPSPGAARNIHEKLEDAGMVQQLTGIAPSVAIHIPWDKPGDGLESFQALREFAESKGVKLGAVNPNLFQNEAYRLSSIASPDKAAREKAVAHMIECVEIMKITGSRDLSLWFPDGTNYAGQDDLRSRKRRVRDALQRVYDVMPDDMRMLVEYKFFEPAFYTTDLCDWGVAYAHCMALGEKAQVLVDLGHHAQGTNIENIVAILLDEGKLGGFHFNNRRYADDDLIVGSANPLELFCIYNELVGAELSNDAVASSTAKGVAYMIDQCHYLENKIEAMVVSVVNCQEALAKALLVDRIALKAAQEKGDLLGANQILMDAYRTDVRPLLAEIRTEKGCPADPFKALRESGYLEKIIGERGIAAAGGGFPE